MVSIQEVIFACARPFYFSAQNDGEITINDFGIGNLRTMRHPLTQHRKQRGIVHSNAEIDAITCDRKPVAPFKLIEVLPTWRQSLSGEPRQRRRGVLSSVHDVTPLDARNLDLRAKPCILARPKART